MSIVIHVSVVLQESEQILFVQEEETADYEKWNLPGGHLEFGETPQEGALREAREETGLDISLTGLVGVYTGIRPDFQAMRFVFRATRLADAKPVAGQEILSLGWFTPSEMECLADEKLVGSATLRRILADVRSGQNYSLSIFTDLVTR